MKLQAWIIVLALSYAPLSADSMFRQFPKSAPKRIRIHSISPRKMKIGQPTVIVVSGENLLPNNTSFSEGIRILKEQYVDSSTILLTVFATGRPDVQILKVGDSNAANLEVEDSAVFFSDNFDDGDISDWNAEKGQWTVSGGQATVVTHRVARIYPAIANTDNVTIDFDMTLLSGKRAGILFQYRDSKNYRTLLIDGVKGAILFRDRFNSSYQTKKKVPLSAPVGAPHHFTIATVNNRINISVDGTQILDQELSAVYSGQIAFYAKAASAQFDNIVVQRDPAANAIPLIDFTYNLVQSEVSLDASLTTDPDGNIAAYSWDLGNGATASGVSAMYTYPHSGNYSVVLSVTDNSGATTKTAQKVVVNAPGSDLEAIQQVVSRFFVLLADVEFRSAQEICVDFSLDPNCPARDKQIKDIEDGQPTIEWFDVQFLSNVSVQFVSSTQAFPVRIRNLLRVKYFGDPAVHWTDGWHQYTMQKEADGRWHQCRYTFELVDEQ